MLIYNSIGFTGMGLACLVAMIAGRWGYAVLPFTGLGRVSFGFFAFVAAAAAWALLWDRYERGNPWVYASGLADMQVAGQAAHPWRRISTFGVPLNLYPLGGAVTGMILLAFGKAEPAACVAFALMSLGLAALVSAARRIGGIGQVDHQALMQVAQRRLEEHISGRGATGDPGGEFPYVRVRTTRGGKPELLLYQQDEINEWYLGAIGVPGMVAACAILIAAKGPPKAGL